VLTAPQNQLEKLMEGLSLQGKKKRESKGTLERVVGGASWDRKRGMTQESTRTLRGDGQIKRVSYRARDYEGKTKRNKIQVLGRG